MSPWESHVTFSNQGPLRIRGLDGGPSSQHKPGIIPQLNLAESHCDLLNSEQVENSCIQAPEFGMKMTGQVSGDAHL